MAKFNLADLLSDMPDVNTEPGREQIEYIDIDHLKSDERNFYRIEGIENLMSSIELLGLQQPVRVREADVGYVIVSGHRRTEALRRLVAEGKDSYRGVPCIVETEASSPELQELRLIYANSDTRTLSSAELQQQAARVEELLYKLQEQGVEFPGRMRDHVAQACNISKSKLARLKAIDNNLAPQLKGRYTSGALNETSAYALSQLPEEDQVLIHDYLVARKYLYESAIRQMSANLDRARQLDCPADIRGGKCEHAASLARRLHRNGHEGYEHCIKVGCCHNCPNIASCPSVCAKCADAATLAKQAKKEAAAKEKAEQAARDAEPIAQLTKLWERYGEARDAAGLSTAELYGIISNGVILSANQVADREAKEQGATLHRYSQIPYSHRMILEDVKAISAAAAVLDCSIDYLLCRTDEPRESRLNTGRTWRKNHPDYSGEFLVKMDCSGTILKRIAYYDHVLDNFYFSRGGNMIDAECLGWYPLPYDEEEDNG